MEHDSKKEHLAGKDVQAKEVTSAMVKNASASGDGSIKRSEEENLEAENSERNNNKTTDHEGTF